MKQFTICLAFCLVLTACTVYTEKQSEVLSQSVYATKDSIDKARVDLADSYIDQAARIVKPPKKRIPIEEIYKPVSPGINIITTNSEKQLPTRERVVIVPQRYKGQTIIVISSKEYEQLLEDKKIYNQLQKEHAQLKDYVQKVDDEITKQKEFENKMIEDLNIMQRKLVEKDLAILQRNVLIIALVAAIAGGIYLRMKGIL